MIQIKAVLIDDQMEGRRELHIDLCLYPEIKVIGELESTEGMKFFTNKTLVDCIFLNTSRMDGIQIGRLEEEINFSQITTVLLSSNPGHAVASYDIGAFDFIFLPYIEHRIELAVNRIIEAVLKNGRAPGIVALANSRYTSKNSRIPIKNGGKIQFIDVSKILFVEASGYYIEINLDDRKHLVRQSLGQFLENLDQSIFVRIHRSTIINVLQIQEIIRGSNNDYSIRTKTDKILRISKSYRSRLFHLLNI